MMPPARVSSKRRRSASVTSGPGSPNINCRPTRSSSVGALIVRGSSSVQQVRPSAAREVLEPRLPSTLEMRDRHAGLDRAPDAIAAAEQIDGQSPTLELVGRPSPAEAPRLSTRLDDQGEVGEEWLEAQPIGDVHLHASAELTAILVEG